MSLPEDATWSDVTTAYLAAKDVVQDVIDSLPSGPTQPPLVSPGYLALGYGDNQAQHRTRVRLCQGADPYNVGQMEAEANAWAAGLAYALHTSQIIDTWYAYNEHNVLVATSLLPTPQSGLNLLHSMISRSFTETLTGHGHTTALIADAGEARCRVFPYKEETPLEGEKFRVIATTTQLLPLAYVLAVSNLIWADFYGQKAGVRGHAPIQFNAYAQKKRGY